MRSQTWRFQRKRRVTLIVVRKHRVKLCTFGSIQGIQRKSRIMHFRRICGVKRSIITKNAEWNGAFLAITRYSRKSYYVREFYTKLIFFISTPQPCLLLNDAKKMGKKNYKISCMCAFKQGCSRLLVYAKESASLMKMLHNFVHLLCLNGAGR